MEGFTIDTLPDKGLLEMNDTRPLKPKEPEEIPQPKRKKQAAWVDDDDKIIAGEGPSPKKILLGSQIEERLSLDAKTSITNELDNSMPTIKDEALICGDNESNDISISSLSPKEDHEEDKSAKKRKKEEPPSWFEVDDDHNTNVYVSNLPLDTTEEELLTLMKKYGLIMKDLESGQFKIKMYKDKDGNFKGDALCCYIKVESVDLALQLLDGAMFKDNEISCERARFQLKGNYDPQRKPKKRKGKEKKKIKERIDRLFDWRPDKLPGERPNCEKTVILKNVFDISEFDKEPELIFEYKTDVREECEAKCGPVKRVNIYDRNPEGVVSVTFQDFDSADKCVELMKGRWFAQRKLEAAHWDGRTKHKIYENEEDAAKRIDGWNQYLECEDESTTQTQPSATETESQADITE